MEVECKVNMFVFAVQVTQFDDDVVILHVDETSEDLVNVVHVHEQVKGSVNVDVVVSLAMVNVHVGCLDRLVVQQGPFDDNKH